MVGQKTTKISTSDEILNSFMMIAQKQDYVTEEQLKAVLSEEQTAYCIKHMKKVGDAYDYKAFINSVLFFLIIIIIIIIIILTFLFCY